MQWSYYVGSRVKFHTRSKHWNAVKIITYYHHYNGRALPRIGYQECSRVRVNVRGPVVFPRRTKEEIRTRTFITRICRVPIAQNLRRAVDRTFWAIFAGHFGAYNRTRRETRLFTHARYDLCNFVTLCYYTFSAYVRIVFSYQRVSCAGDVLNGTRALCTNGPKYLCLFIFVR